MKTKDDFDAKYFEKLTQPDLQLYKIVRKAINYQKVIFYLWTAIIVVLFLSISLSAFEVSWTEGIIGLIIIAVILWIIYIIGLLAIDFLIDRPISFVTLKRAKKHLLSSIPEEFDAGTVHLWKSLPGILAVDYTNRVFMVNLFADKYNPHFVDAENINSVKVENKPKVTSKTTINSSGKSGKTKSKVEDDAYLQIHFQTVGEAPRWLSIPFNKDKIEAESIASALLNL